MENPENFHLILCQDCGKHFDPADLAEVFRHEHRGLSLDDVLGIKGRPVVEPKE